MNNYTAMYWLTRLDRIDVFFFVAIVILALITLGMYIAGWLRYDSETSYTSHKETIKEAKVKLKEDQKRVRPFTLTLILISFTYVFLPSKEDIIVIYAGGKTLDFVQTDSSINKIPHQATKLITDYLDKKVEELNKR